MIAWNQQKINGNKHGKFEPSRFARKQVQQSRKIWSDPLTDSAIKIKKNSITPNLVKPKNTNGFKTGRYFQQITHQENIKIWGSHQLKSHQQNQSQNLSKCVNHTVRTGWRTALSPWSGNAKIHRMNHNWAWISTPGSSYTRRYSDIQFGCS